MPLLSGTFRLGGPMRASFVVPLAFVTWASAAGAAPEITVKHGLTALPNGASDAAGELPGYEASTRTYQILDEGDAPLTVSVTVGAATGADVSVAQAPASPIA